MKNKKLQALIGAIKNIYTIIQSKLRLLTCWQQAVGKTDCVEDVCWDCKKNVLYWNERIDKNSKYFMEHRDRIDKIKIVSDLIEKSIKTIINYDDFHNMEKLLDELGIVTKIEFESALKLYGFIDSDDVYNVIKQYNTEKPDKRIKLNKFIGELSGSTMSVQIRMIKEYKASIKK